MQSKLATLGRNHPKLTNAVFTASLLGGQLILTTDIIPLADSHPGP